PRARYIGAVQPVPSGGPPMSVYETIPPTHRKAYAATSTARITSGAFILLNQVAGDPGRQQNRGGSAPRMGRAPHEVEPTLGVAVTWTEKSIPPPMSVFAVDGAAGHAISLSNAPRRPVIDLDGVFAQVGQSAPRDAPQHALPRCAGQAFVPTLCASRRVRHDEQRLSRSRHDAAVAAAGCVDVHRRVFGELFALEDLLEFTLIVLAEADGVMVQRRHVAAHGR